MTGDEAREKFSAAYDGELAGDDKAAFEAALSADAELAKEYEEFRALLRETSALSIEPPPPPPDFVASVQRKIRARSRGRFYRDRFSQTSGTRGILPILVGIAMLVVLGIAWLTMQYSVVEHRDRAPAPQHQGR